MAQQQNKNQENKNQQSNQHNNTYQNDNVRNRQEQKLQQQLLKRKMIEQKYKKQIQQMKKKYMPLIKFALKHKLRIKTARCGNIRVQYFRVNQMKELLEQNKQKIFKDKDLQKIAISWEKDVIYFKRIQNSPKLRYPKELEKIKGNETAKFASFKFDTAQPKTWLLPVILIGIIAAVLFPLWPYTLKYVIFLICLYLLIFVISIIVLRLIIYILCSIFGVSCWLFPNFFADCTIIQSFIPIFSVKKWDSGIFSIIGRILGLVIIGYYVYHAYIDCSWIYENIQITKTSIDDLHDWGVSKIKGQKNFSQSALTNLNDIMNQTEINIDQQMNLDQEQQNNVQIQTLISNDDTNQGIKMMEQQNVVQNNVQNL